MFCWEASGPGIHVDASWQAPPRYPLMATALPDGSGPAAEQWTGQIQVWFYSEASDTGPLRIRHIPQMLSQTGIWGIRGQVEALSSLWCSLDQTWAALQCGIVYCPAGATATTVMGCTWSVTVFGWVGCVGWRRRERRDPGIPCRASYCNLMKLLHLSVVLTLWLTGVIWPWSRVLRESVYT